MRTGTSSDPDLLRCPRCGSSARDPVGGHCSCCGGSLHSNSRMAMGQRKEQARPVDAVRQIQLEHEAILKKRGRIR